MQKIKQILTFTLLISILFSNTALANSLIYSKKVRWKIIEDFKEEQFQNIYNNNNSLLNEDVNFFETQNKIMIFENIKNLNTSKKKELTIQRDIIKSRISNLEETIRSLDEEIKTTKDEILALSRNIVSINTEITTIKEEIEIKNKEIFENKKVLLEYISHIYKKQNLIYSKEGSEIDSLKTVLINSSSLWDILSEIHFSQILEVTGQQLIEKHRRLIKEMFVKKLDLERKTKSLKEMKSQELIKRKSQLEKRNFREKILAYTKWKEELFQQYIKDKIAVENRLKIKILQNKIKLKEQKKQILSKYNCDYIDENVLNNISSLDLYIQETSSWSTNDCLELNKILIWEAKLSSFPVNTKNIFLWPISPSNWLSSYFRDKSYFDSVWASHDAIDIKAPQWTDIIAPADWYVTFLKEPIDEWYAYVVLKHADGFVTVYWHVNEVLVKKYDFIKAWEVFARSGWELWTVWAWLITTGPHLHFEVYKDKEYVDPLNYLDLTELGEENIPKDQKYIYKFYDDYKEKNWVDYEWELSKEVLVFKLEWETEIDRQKDLLVKYATSDFNNWEVWVEEAVDGNIDPSFLMCIWLAETGLWRNLKTAYNVWNVWNTDSWLTRDFENARSWIYWMVKTLNNKFLSKYNDMSKLSRYWNKSGPIYSSSPINWHNNMVKCLTALKDKHIPDNYNFRTSF